MKAGLNNRIGHYYYRARLYASQLGRFVSRDPIGYEAGVNIFEYVWDSPTNRTDPNGEQAFGWNGWELRSNDPGVICKREKQAACAAFAVTYVPFFWQCPAMWRVAALQASLASSQRALQAVADKIQFWEELKELSEFGSNGYMIASQQLDQLMAKQATLLAEIERIGTLIATLCGR
jgi:RHS repeat-associated protein